MDSLHLGGNADSVLEANRSRLFHPHSDVPVKSIQETVAHNYLSRILGPGRVCTPGEALEVRGKCGDVIPGIARPFDESRLFLFSRFLWVEAPP
jgi:hypothetical protein